ncbi:hypothetical protein A3Q56_03694, partial [Intoshia linei]
MVFQSNINHSKSDIQLLNKRKNLNIFDSKDKIEKTVDDTKRDILNDNIHERSHSLSMDTSSINRSKNSSDLCTSFNGKPKKNLFNASITDSKASVFDFTEELRNKKKKYRIRKKLAAKEIAGLLRGADIIVKSDWLKVRSKLHGWSKYWCIIMPGFLILYKSDTNRKWIGTILLNTCEVIERPSKKDGFCFKLNSPINSSIWATRGPNGESIGAFTKPLPYNHLIFRSPNDFEGNCWLEALEICSKIVTSHLSSKILRDSNSSLLPEDTLTLNFNETNTSISKESTEYTAEHIPRNLVEDEKHFDDVSKVTESVSDTTELTTTTPSIAESTNISECSIHDSDYIVDNIDCDTEYEEDPEDEIQSSVIWSMLKQLKPGSDLSKISLPANFFESRSFLDKLSEYYYHCNILHQASLQHDPFERIKYILKWYLSCLYKKTKPLKKPFNPIIGETFRCFWNHPETDSHTYYIAEQVSHHPPISAFYLTNRKMGYNVHGSFEAKSKYQGNSLIGKFYGNFTISLLVLGEEYTINLPCAHCKGILYGNLSMELGGNVSINCFKTGYHVELELHLESFFRTSNIISGKIKLGTKTFATIHGHWDKQVYISNSRSKSKEKELIWFTNEDIIKTRLERYVINPENLTENESNRVWSDVIKFLKINDYDAAKDAKNEIEQLQRDLLKNNPNVKYTQKLFEWNESIKEWFYKYRDNRPWDAKVDLKQYEIDYVVNTHLIHTTPLIGKKYVDIQFDNATNSFSRKLSMEPNHNQVESFENNYSTEEKTSDNVMSDSLKAAKLDHKAYAKTIQNIVTSCITPIYENQKQLNENMLQVNKNITHLQHSCNCIINIRNIFCIMLFQIIISIL